MYDFNSIIPVPKELLGERVLLEPLEPKHVPNLYEASHKDERAKSVFKYLPYGPFESAEAYLEWVVNGPRLRADPRALPFCIIDRKSQRAVGVISFLNAEPEHKGVEVGHIWITPEYQRTYVNTEANYLLFTYAFDTLGYIRVQWKCNHKNEISRNAALRLGYKYEGTLRNHMILPNGDIRDSDYFSVTDVEWPEVKSMLLAKMKSYVSL
ncbi:uncharacterized protein VTP21DRAFT_2273 [Calcarisporiella thermophila]|uniref:uncharacterized protein n=1 Tax=Calcarisporiella thermophila TaxID=911321 RepID=UPI0037448841